MILRCLPAEVLAADISEFEASGAAATEIGLPMNMILSQLPSGKVEMSLKELLPQFPAGYLQPTESIASYLPTLINLPLMDVVMRIPPDLLALRPDQKDVDASVINMADPFTEEILREQAEAARRNQNNIIDESQVPATEEFVPRDQASPGKTIAPPLAPLTAPLPTAPAVPSAKEVPAIAPIPLVNKVPPASTRTGSIPSPGVLRTAAPTPPSSPSSLSRTISPSGRLASPTRPTTPIPNRVPGLAPSVEPRAPESSTFSPGSPRPTTSLPMPPRPTFSVPQPQVPQPPLRPSTPPAAPAPEVNPEEETPAPESVEVASSSSFPVPGQPDAAADELQRLAALAMQQMEESEKGTDAEEAVNDRTIPLPAAPSENSSAVVMPPAIPVPFPAPSVPVDNAPSFKSITKPIPPPPAIVPPPAQPPSVQGAPALDAAASVALNLNSCTPAELLQIPGCTQVLADAIVRHRSKIGSFKRLEDLLDVPGMNSAAYSSLTGEKAPQSGVTQSLAELLGFSDDQQVSLKDVTDRIACWPDVTGCVLSQSSGLSLVGTVPKNLDMAAIVAFAPRMFEAINKSFAEISGKETDELMIPTSGTSFHIFRNGDLFLIILSRLPQMPDRHVKIARLVLTGLSLRPS